MPDPEELKKIGLNPEEFKGVELYRGKGCTRCHHTGYRGRKGIYELMIMTPAMKSLVLTTSDANEIKRRAIEENGLITLRSDGANKVLAGQTTIEEIYRVSQG